MNIKEVSELEKEYHKKLEKIKQELIKAVMILHILNQRLSEKIW